MQSVFLVKIHEVLNSLTSVHFSLYDSVNSPGNYTKNPKAVSVLQQGSLT